jgi:hypothetical protein
VVTRGPLAVGLIALAGTPDEAAGLEAQLVAIVRLAAKRVAAASYASITALADEDYVIVALSDELVRAVDEAQPAEAGEPGPESPRVPADVVATVLWPRFNEHASEMGLHASVSVPLYAGRCVPIAVLNLYGRDRAALAPLITGIYRVHGYAGLAPPATADLPSSDEGGRELIAGCAEALAVRATIKLALELIECGTGDGPEDAYLSLCNRAAVSGTGLAEAAATVIASEL